MAVPRPWVTPEDVKEYTENEKVAARSDAKIAVDIVRAEEYVIAYTHNDFSNYDAIPEAVKTAILILAESYGRNAVLTSRTAKSETFDDYSYTAFDGTAYAEGLDIAALLDGFVLTQAGGKLTMRLRKL